MPPPTIISAKQAFLNSQTRLLSKPLAPSRQWNRTNSGTHARLPDGAVDDALSWLNHSLHQHCTRVYAPPATRQIAEHIDAAYWGLVDSKSAGAGAGIVIELDLGELPWHNRRPRREGACADFPHGQRMGT